MDKSKSASIAKWGAACAACALAKAKCIRTNEAPGVKCDRCDRLDKDCTNQVHKPRKKRQSKPSKTAQLEERLNSLVDLLKASNGGEIPPGTNIKDYARDYARDFDGCFSSYNSSRASPASTSPPESIAPTFQPFGENGHMPCNCRPVDVDAPLQVESDDTLLAIFMTQLMPQFPFVTLRPGLRAAELSAEKPFLFSTIKMIASYHNLKSMRAQSYYIMKHLYEHMMMRADRSLEMLQVVLLILGYYHYHCMLHAQMGNLASLAVSLAADIGINRAPELSERSRLTVLHHEPTRPRSNEERRALCGVWYMNSVVALAFQRLDPIRYTPYLEQCMKDLEVAREYETDYLIVNLVRIQHLTERISQLHAKEHLPQDLQDISRAPMNVYLDAFQQELDKYRHGLPRGLQNNKLITCHINTATLRLWEPPIIDAAMLEKLGSSFQTLSLSSTYASHLGIFYKCNAALKQWFSFWLGLDTSEYFLLPMPACAQLINAITMLSRWAKLCGTEPGLSQVPAVAAIKTHIMTQPELQIDIGGILDAMVSRFDEARRMLASQEGGSWDNNIWDLATKKMRLTQMRLERWADTVAVHESFATGRYLDSRESSTGASSSFNSPALDKAFPLTVLDPSSVTSAPNCHAIDRHHGGMMDTTGGLHLNQALWQAVGMNQPAGSASWGSAVDIFDNMELDQNFFFDTSSDYNTIVLNTMGQTPSM